MTPGAAVRDRLAVNAAGTLVGLVPQLIYTIAPLTSPSNCVSYIHLAEKITALERKISTMYQIQAKKINVHQHLWTTTNSYNLQRSLQCPFSFEGFQPHSTHRF